MLATACQERVFWAAYLGLVPYRLALVWQECLGRARAEGIVPDVLLLLEHPLVFTVGRFRGEGDVLMAREKLAQESIEILPANRGGGITCHGPGQLVGYPIMNLKEKGLSVRGYIAKLEAVIIDLLVALGLPGGRVAGYPGVWVDGKKVCSVGIHVSRGITTHGFALNVSNDRRYFNYIRPCGLDSEVMSSLSELRQRPVGVETLIKGLIGSFSAEFGLRCEPGGGEWLAIPDALIG